MDAGSLSSSYTLVGGYGGSASTYTVSNGVEGIITGTTYRFITTAVSVIGTSD